MQNDNLLFAKLHTYFKSKGRITIQKVAILSIFFAILKVVPPLLLSGLAQFERYPGMLARRKEIISRYDAAFKPLGIETLDHYNAEHESSGHLYITRVPGITPEQRNEIIIKMAEQGVACNVHYKPLPMHTALTKDEKNGMVIML